MKTRIVCSFLGLFLFGPAIAADTSSSAFILQYLPNSNYETVIGLGWYGLDATRPGYYINAQVTTKTTSARDDFYRGLSVDAFGDPVTDSISDFAAINIGSTYSLGKHFDAFLGIGYASVDGYAEKYDPLFILDSDGSYLVRDPSLDDSGANVNAGLLLHIKRLSIEFGYHSFVKRGYIGVGLSF